MISGPTRAFADAFAASLEEQAAELFSDAEQHTGMAKAQYLLQATLLLRVANACRKASGS
jgi:hypothetical protein